MIHDIESAGLARRVLDALPAHGYEMTALLSLLRIEASREVPTAAVSCERRPVLRINPDFVAAHCESDEHLFLLVLHELHHVLLGHTRLFERPTRAHNIAFDAVINALLCRRFPRRAFTSFFSGLYAEQEWPLRLLAPPGGPEPAACEPKSAAFARLHHRLYFDGQVTSQEVFELLVEALAGDDPSSGDAPDRVPGSGGGSGGGDGSETDGSEIHGSGIHGSEVHGSDIQHRDGPPLLGNHGEGESAADAAGDAADLWGTGGALAPEFVAAIRNIVERWPPPEAPLGGRDLGSLLRRETVSAAATLASGVLRVVRNALDRAATPLPGAPRPRPGERPALVVQPNLSDRRGLVQREAGSPPLLWAGAAFDRRGRDPEATRVYLDVSGSMWGYLPALYRALAIERRRIAPQVGLFSTEVVTVPLADLLRGRRDTTGGTDLRCVAEDALARRVRRALIVTDGYVGALDEPLRRRLERSRVRLVVLLTPNGWRPDLAPLRAPFFQLPPLPTS